MDKPYWENRYINGEIGWDVGTVTEPLRVYFDQLVDKDLKILIPGAGNGYEVEYLFKKGFSKIFLLDIAEQAVHGFKSRVPDFPSDHIIIGDFFDHEGKYDLMVEQTFFCAILPGLRADYVQKCYSLLKDGGKLAGLLWDGALNNDKPPFGGNAQEYNKLFSPFFNLDILDRSLNSIAPRQGREFFFEFVKKDF